MTGLKRHPGKVHLASQDELIRVSDVFREKTLFVIGATGFLGKVYLYFLLRRHVDVEKIYCLIRPRPGKDANERLKQEVLKSPAFDPLREVMGSEAFDWIAMSKLEAIEGDIGKPSLGVDPAKLERLIDRVDAIINSSGLVDFNPPLEEALFVNSIGIQNVVQFAETLNAPLMHVSTCYVAGNRSGAIFEDEAVQGFFPYKELMDGVTFDPQRELEEGLQLARMIREEAEHQELSSYFINEARRRLREENRNPEDLDVLTREIARVKEKWVARKLADYGVKRAGFYGWTNIYTYSKSLGEQAVSRAKVPWTIVRPSIIESALRHPFPGWNEGFNTSAPLAFISLKGHINLPAGKNVNLDLVPVDHVAAAMVAVTAALLLRRHKAVYHLATGDLNPCSMNRTVELVGLVKRRHYQNRSEGNPILNQLYARFEPIPVTLEEYERISAPMFNRLAGLVADTVERVASPQRGGLLGMLKTVEKSARAAQKSTAGVMRLMDIFLPFTVHNAYRFRCDNIRALYQHLSPEDQSAIPWDPERIDWLRYWMDVHMPGLEKWVFPKIKDKLKKNPLPNIYTYEDILELFDAATTNHSEEVAMRILAANGSEESYTYAQVRSCAAWVSDFLSSHGVCRGDRIVLYSENRPQWGMAYFGIVQAGATSVPIDYRSSPREVANLAKAADARAILISDRLWESHEDALLASVPDSASIYTFGRIFQPRTEPTSTPVVPRQDPDRLATLIFTSGTTGTPKAVMLSHRNFTSLVSAMAKVFRLGPHDRMLSVLPLHHTFEFSTSFLLPFSRGASIHYIEELNAELIQMAFSRYRVTAMVGVPALWELLFRKIQSRARERGAIVEGLFMGLQWLNRALRDRTGMNLGKALFGSVHSFFGGRIRYFISGAAALPGSIQKGYDALGFDMYEGYGLTEAAPVLTVNRPGRRPRPGTVGVPLPGVEVKIHQPDESGVGEIIASGPNVMQGYYNEPVLTADVLKDGWLFTGDLGRIDSHGRVYIMGRRKEVIVDASGKNVYPDEIEELYAGCNVLKELCVVGIPDGRGSEQVACLVVPETEGTADGLSSAEVRSRIEDHFRSVGLTLPYHQRVKVLRFRDQLLPRTTTRKIKRKDVVRLLESILKAEDVAVTAGRPVGQVSDLWLIEVVARVVGRSAGELSPATRFADDLGMDSLMAAELLAALEDKSGGVLEIQDLIDSHTIEGLAQRLRERSSTYAVRPVPPGARRHPDRPWRVDLSRLHEVEVPGTVRSAVKHGLRTLQRTLYEDLLDVTVKGRAFIPANRNVLVIANHCSHLDMGLVKTALGGYGEQLVTLAAADYFFAEGPRRFYFENFTNAVPLDRINPTRESIRRAQQLLEEGYSLLLFPEGTRSTNGDIQIFKRGVGMMALRFKVDVLPIFIKGSHSIMPKGAMLPRGRRLEVRIGAPVLYSELERLTREMPALQAQAHVASLLQSAVEALRDGITFDLAAAANAGPARPPLELLFEDLNARFDPRHVEAPVTFYFTLGPDEDHKWTVSVEAGACRIFKGKPEGKADCVLKTSISMFSRIVREGYVPAVTEFMDGTVKTNDPGRLQQLQTIFNLSIA